MLKFIAASLFVAALLLPTPARSADEIHWTFTGPTSVTVDWRGSESTIRYGLTTGYGSTATAQAPSPLPFSSSGPFQEAKRFLEASRAVPERPGPFIPDAQEPVNLRIAAGFGAGSERLCEGFNRTRKFFEIDITHAEHPVRSRIAPVQFQNACKGAGGFVDPVLAEVQRPEPEWNLVEVRKETRRTPKVIDGFFLTAVRRTGRAGIAEADIELRDLRRTDDRFFVEGRSFAEISPAFEFLRLLKILKRQPLVVAHNPQFPGPSSSPASK